ncbi:glucose 1-dehydrogenase [Cryobacterium frigoriphilum]|uniref:Glucose 1-dehydrogenase n=2 Tax=Cryobacterium frigoriphilum TaxID=1259150 RepID=A0A4R8ZV85_9MICO|nr:glucose 1-dehydrogenase [Cryobacterium frigoriphilum]
MRKRDTMGDFDGKAGLVSGAAGGIGRATALAFAREGGSVVVADLEALRPQAEETVRLITSSGGSAIFVPTDVTRAADVEALVNAVVETYGSLDFAHNNAGILKVGFTAEIDEADFDQIIAVDLKGVWLAMKYEILQMQKQGGGAIVNTASEAGLVGTPLAGPYVAAKHAVVGLTKTAAGEYANQNIRINAVAPGAIETPMITDLPQQARDSLLAPQPLHRFGTADEVADAVLWLASSRSSFVVGAILSIDGGATSNAQSYSSENSPPSSAVVDAETSRTINV